MQDFGRRVMRGESDVPPVNARKISLRNKQPELDIPSIGRAKTLKAMLIYFGFIVTAAVCLGFFLLVDDPIMLLNRPLE